MSFYKITIGDTPLISDINQIIEGFRGEVDVGQLALAPQISAPGTAGNGASTSGGELEIGTYKYVLTFVTGVAKSNGDLYVTGETTASPEWSVLTSAGFQRVSLTSLPVGGPTVIAKRIYRTTVGGADHKLVAQIPASATTHTDSVGDAALGAAVPTANTTGTNLTIPYPKQATDAASLQSVRDETQVAKDYAKQEADAARAYADQVSADSQALNEQTAADSKTYTDQQVAASKAYTDAAVNETLIVESVAAIENQEAEQVWTSLGPAVEFADGRTTGVIWHRTWPFGDKGMELELRYATSTSHTGDIRLQFTTSVDGGEEYTQHLTLTPGSGTTLKVVAHPLWSAGNVPSNAMVTFRLRRLGADAADTHTGALRIYHTKLKAVS